MGRTALERSELSGNWPRRSAPLLALLLLVAGVGCSGRPDKEAGSGLWVEPEDAVLLDDTLVSQIAGAHVRELFVPLADLDVGTAGGPLRRRPVPELPASSRVNVVVVGRLELDRSEIKGTVRAVAEGLRRTFGDLESRGIAAPGAHFDVDGLDAVDEAASFFNKLRSELGPKRFVSLTLRHSRVDDPKLRTLARSVDFVVAFLYGQREDEPESKEAWDLEVVRQRLDRLEDAGVPYMLGVSGVGRVTHTDGEGRVRDVTTERALRPFMWNRGMRLKRGIDPDDANRPVYTLVAENGARAGGWEIAPGDEVRVLRPTTTDLGKLLDLAAEGDYPRLLGQLYYRLPAPEEALSITVENVRSALAAEPPAPDLELEVKVSRRARQSTRLRFVLTNANGEATEYALLGNNYLQIKTDPNILGRVDPGDFYGYDVLRLGPDGESERVIRNSNAVRLHVPVIEGHQRVESGDVVIHRRSPTLELEARFLMPDGHTVVLGPLTWDGELHDAEPGG